MDVVIFLGTYLLMAFGAAIGLVMLVGGTLHVGVKKPDGFLIYFFIPVIVVVMLGTLTSGRDLSLPEDLLGGMAQPGGVVKWVQRFANLFLLAASVERIAVWMLSKRRPETPHALLGAFVFFWICTVALPASFGTRPGISHEFLYSLLIGFAAMLTTEHGAVRAIKVARGMLLIFMLVGLVVLVVKKSMVLGPYTGSWIPGFSWRYSGLATGPNAMGPLCVLALICFWSYPFKSRWLQYVAWFVGIASLGLTQSKTSWLAAIICFVTLLSVQERKNIKGYLSEPRFRMATLAVLTAGLFLLVLLMVIAISGVLNPKIAKVMASKLGGDLLTLTGRNQIWAIAIYEWEQNPLFGYGPTIWDPLFRYQIRNPAAFHAHNQVLNILAASGLIGLLGFLVYCVPMLKRFASRFASFNGLTLGVFILMLLRSISEVPLNLESFGGESLAHILLLMALGAARPAESAPLVQSRANGWKSLSHA